MRFKPESEHGANNGLNIARDHMQTIKEKFPWISYGDLWTLGGVAAVQELGGPVIKWRPGRIVCSPFVLVALSFAHVYLLTYNRM